MWAAQFAAGARAGVGQCSRERSVRFVSYSDCVSHRVVQARLVVPQRRFREKKNFVIEICFCSMVKKFRLISLEFFLNRFSRGDFSSRGDFFRDQDFNEKPESGVLSK